MKRRRPEWPSDTAIVVLTLLTLAVMFLSMVYVSTTK